MAGLFGPFARFPEFPFLRRRRPGRTYAALDSTALEGDSDRLRRVLSAWARPGDRAPVQSSFRAALGLEPGAGRSRRDFVGGNEYAVFMTLCRRRRFLQSLPAMAASFSSKAAVLKGLGIPGPYKGRVVAVHHPRSIVSGAYQAEPVRDMMRRGMRELTGADDGWKQFFEPGDVVGIKVNPVGSPHVISAPEVLREIIAGVVSTGVKPQDIVVYDRYRKQFLGAGFDKWLPEKVRWSGAVEDYDDIQLGIAGYDPEHYMEMPLTQPGQDPTLPLHRRSYASNFITKEVNKLINLCVLKDHQSAGVTLALKNLSHGLVNNVARSHSTSSLNACGSFIPAVVQMPVIRNKTVLQIMDGIKGLYHGGPGA
ncbi:MAG: DUF362 domain-containing protein, partial [Acidobacteria bacterium]|nr:DUF362 domain-containing protein [Acidobacteriota bacterium]